MISDFQAAANLAFIFATTFNPILEEWEEESTESPFGFFWDFSLLEAALWLKLGVDTEYLRASDVREAVDHLEPALLTAFARIQASQKDQPSAQKEMSSWSKYIVTEAGTPTLLREVFFAAEDVFANEEDLVRSTYQNYLLLSSEMAYEPSNVKFLTALNFETSERWERICSGDLTYSGITSQDFSLATMRILRFLSEMVNDEAGLPIINYRAKGILRWKLNLADPTVESRFMQACGLVFASALQPLDTFSRSSAFSYFKILVSYLTSSWTGSGSHFSSAAQPARSIDELEVSVRTYNALRNADIKTLGDLVQKTEAQLLAIPHVSQQSIEEIREVLARLGLRLGMTLGAHGEFRGSERWAPPVRPEREEL